MRKISRAEDQFTPINFRTASSILDDVANGVDVVANGVANAAGSVNNDIAKGVKAVGDDIAKGINAVGKGVADVVGGGGNAAKSDLKKHPVAPKPEPTKPKAQPTYPDTDRAKDIAEGIGPDPHDPTENDPTKGDRKPSKPKPAGEDDDKYDKQLDAAKGNKADSPQLITFMKEEDNAEDARNGEKPEYKGLGQAPIPTGNNSNAQGSETYWGNGKLSSFNERYASEKGESGKFKPPAGVISAAKHALELIEQGKAGDGFTSVGRHRAHQLAAGEMVPLSDIKRMHSYFSRHGVDKKGKDWDNDSPGKVAWLAWGGDAGKSWAASIVKKHGGGDNKKEASGDAIPLGPSSMDFSQSQIDAPCNIYHFSHVDHRNPNMHWCTCGNLKTDHSEESRYNGYILYGDQRFLSGEKEANVSMDPNDWRNEYFNLDSDW